MPGRKWRELVDRGFLEETGRRTARPRDGVFLRVEDGQLRLQVEQTGDMTWIKTSWSAIERAALYRVWGQWVSQPEFETGVQRHHTER